MKPKKAKKPSLTIAIGNMRTEPVAVEIDNPLYAREHDGDKTNPRKIGAFINARESAITMLAAKAALSASQVAAAERFRQLWERLGGAGAGAMDYSRVVVDGGKTPEPISAAQMEAGQKLKNAQKALKNAHGEYAYRLVGYIAGQGYSIHELCETRRQRDTMTDMLRMYLDCLAEHWLLSTRARVMSKTNRESVEIHGRLSKIA